MATEQYAIVYKEDPPTKVFLDNLSISNPMDEPTLLQLLVTYRTTIARNLSGNSKVDLFTTNKHLLLQNMFVVLLSLCSVDTLSLF